MPNIEKKVIIASTLFLLLMMSFVIYSIFGLGIRFPSCVTTVLPFQKGQVIKKAEGFYEVHVVARMWAFEPEEIQVPTGSTLDIFLASVDVTHGFNIENTNVNLMAVPGTVNYARVKLNNPGVYHIVCHEFCGAGHQSMAGAVVVGEEGKREILLSQYNSSTSLGGQHLFQTKGCVACHSLDGKAGVGPSLKGIFGSKEKLIDGSEVTVDEAYIQESIKSPSTKIVQGFKPVMPTLPISDDEMKQLITYIKSL